MNPSAKRARLALGAAAALLALHAALAWALRTPSITIASDDAVNLLLARGLRHLSYHNPWIVGAPPQAQYPPFYPAVLTLAQTIFGSRLDVALALNVLCSTAALGTGLAMVRRWSEPLALLGLAAAAVNPWLVRLAGQATSEPLFLFLLMQSLWWAARPEQSGRTRALAGTMAIAASLTRPIGVVLVAALLVEWLLKRRFRTAALFATVTGLLVGAWFVWMLMAPRGLPGQSYVADALFTDGVTIRAPQRSDSSRKPAARDTAAPPQPTSVVAPSTPSPRLPSIIARRVRRNTQTYLSVGVFSALALPVVKATRWDNWAWLLALLVLAIPGVIELTRRLRPATLLLVCYTGLLLVWPYAVERYLVPMIPLLLTVLLLGARRLMREREDIYSWLIPLALTAALVSSGLAESSVRLAAAAHCDRAAPLVSAGCYGPEQRAFFAAALEGDREAPPGAVFLSPKSPILYYLTGRRSVDTFRAASLPADSLREYLRATRVEYIVLSRVHLDQRWIARNLRPSCSEWRLKADYRDGGAVLLQRVSGDSGSPEQRQASCEAIGRVVLGPW